MQTTDLLTFSDLSALLKVPVQTLYGWRSRGEGPPGMKVGRHVRYRRDAVEAWLDELGGTSIVLGPRGR